MKLPAVFNDISKLETALSTYNESFWLDLGVKRVLKLFKQMSKRVPAYKDFLKQNKINPSKIKTIKDFKNVPPIDKENYLRNYPYKSLFWDGVFDRKRWVISTTSGSTGEPFYFPREEAQDLDYIKTAELYLRNNFNIDKKTTLYIDGFAMGAWIGGLFTYQAIKSIAERGNYSMSIITPGIFKNEIIKALKKIGPFFDQVIIGGYPPMIKDTIDDAIKSGVNWKDYDVGFIFSAEGFCESFRDYVIKKACLQNEYTTTLNHYGSVDLGTMAHETPISIFLRRFLLNKPTLYNKFFDNEFRLPTFAQYNPTQFYFEEVNKRLYCSSYSGLPLIRYDLKDHGGIYTFKDVKKILKKNKINLSSSIKKISLGKAIWNLPFVYVYERSDFIVKLYGANIYPETIRKSLSHSMLAEKVTGKFTIEISFDSDQNQFLKIHIELKDEVSVNDELVKFTENIIVEALLMENSEYRSNFKESPIKQRPKITFWDYEHPKHFKSGVKQHWVK